MISLNGEFTISNFVEGILNSINPENVVLAVKIQEEYNYIVPEEYFHLFEDEKHPEETMDPIINNRVYHNFIFYAPSNYVKVFYNNDNSMSMISIVKNPFELTCDHDSAWRSDGFVQMEKKSNEIIESLKSKVYGITGLEISKREMSSMNMVKSCRLLNLDHEDFMNKVSKTNRMYPRSFYFCLNHETKTINLDKVHEWRD